MANIKSQIKRNRQTLVRHERNKAMRSELKTRMKAVTTAADDGDATSARDAYVVAQKRIDMAVTKGLIHKNNAARKKARLAKRLNAL
jgi:small subunit ribosomal protein S20